MSEAKHTDMLVTLIAGLIAGIAAGALLVLYGVF